jgi:hypothetical protein
VISAGQKKPTGNAKAFVNCLQNYAHVPPVYMQALTPMNDPLPENPPMQAPALEDGQATADLTRDAQSLRERVDQILKKENSHD